MKRTPVHPIFVHFTVALTSASFVFDAFAFFGASVGDTGWWLLAAAVVSTVMTVATGIYERTQVCVPEGEARKYLRTHMALGPTLFGFMIAQCMWRALIWQEHTLVPAIYFAGAFVVFILLFAQAFLGGELVYRFRMAVR